MPRALITSLYAALVTTVASLGCGQSEAPSCPTGAERCACYSDKHCQSLLTCLSGVCVRAPSAETSVGAERRARAAALGGTAATTPNGGSAAPPASAKAGSNGGAETPSSGRIADAGTPSSGGGKQAPTPMSSQPASKDCVAPGGDCAAGSCCGGAFCLSGVCAGPCNSNRDCASRCCSGGSANVCAPAAQCFAGSMIPAGALDASVDECAPTGSDCSSTWCCSGPCIQNVCATSCAASSECESGCCYAPSSGGAVCAPSTICAGHVTSGGIANAQNVAIGRCPGELTLISGDSSLSGENKQFLGNATSNKAAVDGVCNEASSYGSKFGTDSIFNMYGMYGSEYSSQSAYNKYTSTPPVLFCAATKTELNPVTKSTVVGLAIDPDLLCHVLEANGY